MDLLLSFWLVCLASPGIVWIWRRVRPRLRRKPRVVQTPGSLPRLTRDPQGLERLVADLARLERDFRRIETSSPPSKMQRLQAVSLAYDDVLCECCDALGLPAPSSRPLNSVDRMQTECELVQHGLTW